MLRAILLVALGLAALTARAPAAAAGTVGVIVTGEAALQPPLVAHLESWLRSHGHEVVALSLDPAATGRLVDCFTMDDSACARKVVETSARSESVVYARAVREGPTINLTVHWVVKNKPPVGGRRGCEQCTTDALRGAADALMESLGPATAVLTGRLKLSSQPEGMIVMLDGMKVGVTPLDRDIAAGPHSIVLVSGGTKVGDRIIEIEAGSELEVTIPVVYPRDTPPPPPPVGPSRVPPVLCWVGGAGAIAGGAVALYYGNKSGPDEKYVYPGATAAGVALVSAGAVSIGVGVWLWVRGSRESAPVATIGPGGGYLGWHGRF